MKSFRIRYFVMVDHPRFGHTRESGVFDCKAESKDTALDMAQKHCSNMFKRVKKEDFKPTETHRYKHEDEFGVFEMGSNQEE